MQRLVAGEDDASKEKTRSNGDLDVVGVELDACGARYAFSQSLLLLSRLLSPHSLFLGLDFSENGF